MNPTQIISIVAAVIVSAIVVSASVIMNMPKHVEEKSADQMNVDNGQQKREQVSEKKWSLKDIINSVTSKN